MASKKGRPRPPPYKEKNQAKAPSLNVHELHVKKCHEIKKPTAAPGRKQ